MMRIQPAKFIADDDTEFSAFRFLVLKRQKP